jgi:YfiH family protein
VVVEGVQVLHFRSFEDERIVHAITTRAGGVSPAPCDELNLSWARTDDPRTVLENRRRVCAALNIPPDRIVQSGQVHGVDVRAVGAAEAGRGARERQTVLPPSDALITADPDVYLLACFADCVPLLLFDPIRLAVGVAHAGWRGTLQGMGPATVRAMAEHYGSRPADLRVVIGPSAGSCCYEVGGDVIAAVEASDLPSDELLRPSVAGHAFFDLWKTNRCLLQAAGVQPEHIETSGICTIDHHDRFFSHRASGGNTGRFGAIIGIRPQSVRSGDTI